MPSLVIPPVIGGLGDTNLVPANLAGTTVTGSGTAHVKGSYATIIATTTKPSYGIYVKLKEVAAGNANTSQLVDIAFGDSPSGGNEEILIPNLDGGATSVITGSEGKHWFFPVYIPSGVSIRARLQGAIVSDTAVVSVILAQDPAYRWACGAVTTYGADTATSSGTTVAPGSGSFGSWTQIGTGTDPVRAHRFWTVGYSIGTDTTSANGDLMVEIGTGPDASNVSRIGQFHWVQTSGEDVSGPYPSMPVYAPVVAGGELWARIASNEVESRRVVIHGMD